MGSNKNYPRQKCADMFLKLNTIKNKAKVFTFHCTLCSTDCDQLKKFAKHLENHLEYFENELSCNAREANDINKINLYFESEDIKAESDELVNDNNGENNTGCDSNKSICGDPLETERIFKTEMDLFRNIKSEQDIMEETENSAKSFIKMNSNEIGNINEALVIVGETKRPKITELTSEDALESSARYDFVIERERKISSNPNGLVMKTRPKTLKTGKSSTKNTENTCSIKPSSYDKPKKRRRVIMESILPFLIQQYKKYEILWQVNDMAFGIKIKKYEIYSKIAESLKLEKNKIITLEDLNYQLNYLNELYSKDREQELKCKMDEKNFMPEYEHYEELSFLSQSQGPFLCSICNKILPRYHAYYQHMAQHNDTQPYKCPLCDSSFISYYKYLVHKKRHLGILDFHCKICGKGYMFKNDLEWHVTSHSGDKPYLCQICGAGFRARHHYNSHVRRHEERFRHECHICKKGFNYLDNLKSHVKSHLNIRDIVCHICGKGFVHTKYLKRHVLIHGEEKHYKCNECGKAFFQSSGLRAHRKNHHS